jgi:hypothetical protein
MKHKSKKQDKPVFSETKIYYEPPIIGRNTQDHCCSRMTTVVAVDNVDVGNIKHNAQNLLRNHISENRGKKRKEPERNGKSISNIEFGKENNESRIYDNNKIIPIQLRGGVKRKRPIEEEEDEEEEEEEEEEEIEERNKNKAEEKEMCIIIDDD